MVAAAEVEKLNRLLQALTNYAVVEGDQSVWELGQTQGLIFKANGAFSKFTGVKLDGTLLEAAAYEAEAYAAEGIFKLRLRNGSTIVTLQSECLGRLAAGPHRITILYTDGEAAAEFTVAGKAETPAPEESERPGTSQQPEGSEKPGTSQQPEGSEKPGTSQGLESEKLENDTTGSKGLVESEERNVFSGSSKIDSPKTEDESKQWLWLILGALGLSIWSGLFIKKNKRNGVER
ncbi:MAG: hypothetical protein HFI75_10000 [Lachnospiraceae bacterium]|nr:hypothetical protein [Lachnospiraceae bacterium]